MGAVMGAKGLKAIVVDDTGGANPPLAHREAFRAAMGRYTQILQTNPQTSQVYTFYGTAAMVSMANAYGGLPTCNFSAGQFSGAEAISGERLHDLILERGGEGDLTHACMPGCVIKCSNVFAGPDGKAIVSPLEYETIGLLGSNLGLADLDAIARLNWLCNDVGLDTIEIGAALAVAAEAGVLDFGDAVAAAMLIEEAREGTPLGRLVGSGAMAVGRSFGNIRVPAVKGQAMSAYEPRAVKGTGVTYATSPQGADHTAGLTIRAKIDHLKPEGQAALSKKTQVNVAAFDTMGLCLFVTPAVGWEHQVMVDLLNARFGSRCPPEYITELGRRVLGLELEFNRRAGFLPLDDRLPEFMAQEPLPPHQVVFDVSGEDLAGVFEDLRGQVSS
jgi:aldehyde:ferredoxin oxidoreductase